jgi:hypothetical protein
VLLLFINDRKVTPGGRAAEDSESVRRVGAATPPNQWPLKHFFHLIRSDSVASQVLDVVVPLELHWTH